MQCTTFISSFQFNTEFALPGFCEEFTVPVENGLLVAVN